MTTNDDYENWGLESIRRRHRALDQLADATTPDERRVALAEIRAAHQERRDLLETIEDIHDATGHRSVRASPVPMRD